MTNFLCICLQLAHSPVLNKLSDRYKEVLRIVALLARWTTESMQSILFNPPQHQVLCYCWSGLVWKTFFTSLQHLAPKLIARCCLRRWDLRRVCMQLIILYSTSICELYDGRYCGPWSCQAFTSFALTKCPSIWTHSAVFSRCAVHTYCYSVWASKARNWIVCCKKLFPTGMH